MELNYLKDHLFDLLNESELLNVQDVKADDENNVFHIVVYDGTKFDISCKIS